MKRWIALILSVTFLLSLASCTEVQMQTQESEERTEEGATVSSEAETTEEKVEYPKVLEPLTLERLNAIPIAKQGMSSQELRQICMDYFHMKIPRFIETKLNAFGAVFFHFQKELLLKSLAVNP